MNLGMNVLWIQNHHHTPHNHFFTCPSGADLWLVGNALRYSKCACLKRTIKQKLEWRSLRDSLRKNWMKENRHGILLFWKGMGHSSILEEEEIASFLLKLSKPKMLFFKALKCESFNVISSIYLPSKHRK